MPKNIATGTASTSPIRNCSWGYKCERIWDSLIATDSNNIRFCDACEKEVYLCKTKRELADSVLLNRCVAFPSRLLPPQRGESRLEADFKTNSKRPIVGGWVDPDYFK
jgi:hypothetical protein